MKQQYEKILQNFENELKTLQFEIDDILQLSEKSIQLSLNTIDKIREKTVSQTFQNDREEIQFFKHIKPRFISRLIYYNKIYNIETHRPNGSIKVKRKYLQIELKKLKNYFDENLDFYRYYRTGSSYLDSKYFIRGKQDIRLRLDSYCYETDPRFSTSHDFKISNILANDLLQVYLENELTKLDFQYTGKETSRLSGNTLQWTGSKVALIELLYALHTTGSFNNGNTDIKTIAAYLEKAFNIELGEYYRTYLEIRLRNNPTKFLDTLKNSLLRKMEEDDEK